MKKIIAITLLAALMLTGCTEAERVSINIAQQADLFNVRRRVTVINCRTDEIILSCEGVMSITDGEDRLDVIVELPSGEYQKHIIKLNEWTCWTVEQIESNEVDKYNYEWNFLPEMIPGVKIISED